MRTLIIYDSLYGNTERIAQLVGNVLQQQGEVEVIKVGAVRLDKLGEIDLLVIGSPTQQFRPTVAMRDFLNTIPNNFLKGKKVAVFDTRLTQAEIEKSPPLPFFVKIYGFAAQRLEKKAKQKGAQILLPGEGFFVEGMKGPLVAGEVERAKKWASELVSLSIVSE